MTRSMKLKGKMLIISNIRGTCAWTIFQVDYGRNRFWLLHENEKLTLHNEYPNIPLPDVSEETIEEIKQIIIQKWFSKSEQNSKA